MNQKKYVKHVVIVSDSLSEIIERTRRQLGLSISGFYKYAAIRLLQELSVLKNAVAEEASNR